MKLDEYKDKIRELRGSLKSCDDDLYTIYHQSCRPLLNWSLSNKYIGVTKIRNVACLNYKTQREFITWMDTKRRSIQEVDVWLLSKI